MPIPDDLRLAIESKESRWTDGSLSKFLIKTGRSGLHQNRSFPTKSLFPKTCHANGWYPREKQTLDQTLFWCGPTCTKLWFEAVCMLINGIHGQKFLAVRDEMMASDRCDCNYRLPLWHDTSL